MRKYEVMYVLNASMDDAARQAEMDSIHAIITTNGGNIVKTDVWGMKKLAYPIQKMNEGYYVVVEFAAKPELPHELDRRMKISDNVIRHMIINKDEK